MRKTKWLFLMAWVMLSQAVLVAQTGITHVWAVDEGEKVKQDELNHWARTDARNPVWDGSTIRVFGGRNEVVGFQVILEAAGTGATGVDVRLDGLQGPGYTITNTGGIGDPMDFVGKRIEVFVESYINVTKRSDFSGTWGWVRPMPDVDHLGWLPDGLVPVEAPNKSPEHGAGGAPFPIGAGRTQGVWIDVYIPPEAPPGLYQGTVRVLQNGTETHQIPIALQVYGFTLSDSTHFRTMFAYGGLIAERHGYAEGTPEFWGMMHQYMNVFHRHRMDLNPGNHPVDVFAANLGGYYTGAFYSSSNKYGGPGAGVGNQTYGIGLYDQPSNGWASGFWPNTAASWQAAADAWETWFRANAPTVDRFKFLTDEPIPANYGIDIERATWIQNSPGVGKNLRTYSTVKIDPRLYGTVKFWALTGQSGYDPGDGVALGYNGTLAKQRQAQGEKIAFYNGTRPGYGVTEPLDNALADNRVNPWIAFKHNVDQYFLWIVGFISGLSINRDVWVDNYYGDATTVAWGSGQYVYPGEDTKIPSESRGVKGPIVSMRMKNFRRGMQDYEYLWLARRAGISEDTLKAVMNSVIPAVLDEVPQGSQPTYAERGYPYESARRRLAELLIQATGGVATPAGSLRATPAVLPAGGGTVTLDWNSTNATTAVLNNGIGAVALSGSRVVSVTTTTSFQLVLQNGSAQQTISASVAVTASPTVPAAVELALPANGATGISLQSALTWTATSTAVSYQVQVSTGAAFSSNALDVSGVTATNYSPATLAGGTAYFWRVRAANTAGTGPWSVARSFTTAATVGGSNGTATQVLRNNDFESGTQDWTFYTGGVGSFVAATPGFSGTTAARISIATTDGNIQLFQQGVSLEANAYYRLSFAAYSSSGNDLAVGLLQHASPFTNYGLQTRMVPLSTGWKTYTIYLLTKNFSGTVADARLQFWFPGFAAAGDEYWLDALQLLKTNAPPLPPAPAFLRPSSGARNLPNTLIIDWAGSEGVDGYRVQLAKDASFASLVCDTVVVDTTVRVGPLAPATRYYRRISAINITGSGPFAAPSFFTTAADQPDPSKRAQLPAEIQLDQNYPNPFNPATMISYRLPAQTHVSLIVYNTLGAEVAVLENSEQPEGEHSVPFNGAGLPSGVYFCRLRANGVLETRKMILAR